MTPRPSALLLLLQCWLTACTATGAAASAGTAFTIPNGGAGAGFDDLRYSKSLHRVLVPGGRAGVLALVEPETGAMTAIEGFSKARSFAGGHDFGVTSVDEGRGLLFATDRTTRTVNVINPSARTIIASFKLGAEPDYVRYVEPTRELWISEPAAEQLEIVSMSNDTPPTLSRAATIHVDNGPESLVIDALRGRAYTHRWQASTLAIDVKTREVVGDWQNGCRGSRGIDLEPEHGFVFAACSEGRLSLLDPEHDGKIVSSVSAGSGYDVMGYNASLRHAYLAGGKCSCMTTVDVSNAGELSLLGRTAAPRDTHCVVADDVGSAWVCEPSKGQVRKISDPYPATRE
ncbi:MAG TPA: hypothetical protein VJV78_44545 [Polyangiales bacterium]|nr:hypothetical protein [Polyangiales bacterium]